MSRKHYIAIAAAIKDSKADKAAAEHIAQALADVLKQDNSSFDRSRFLEACGVRS